MSDTDVSKFTCKECGGHTLIVTHVWTILAGVNSERWQEWGPLENNHHWHYEFREKIENDIENELQGDGVGDFDEDDTESSEYEVYQTGNGRENDEFFVNCETCDREVKFGWSEPDRHGLILPVEFRDFVTLDSWPDPKYIDDWQQQDSPKQKNSQS